MSDGVVYAENADGSERTVFSSRFACPVSGFSIEEIEPRLFSFNSPHGACPACDGLGVESFLRSRPGGTGRPGGAGRGRDRAVDGVAIAILRPDAAKPGAPLWSNNETRRGRICRKRCGRRSCSGQTSQFRSPTRTVVRSYTVTKPFEGVLKNLQRRWQETDSVWVREEMGALPGGESLVSFATARG